MEGVFIGAGPRFRNQSLAPASLMDVPPTILYLLGVPVPSEMDGHVLTEFIQPDYVASHRPGMGGAPIVASRVDADESPYTPEETEVILEHLRSLGYL